MSDEHGHTASPAPLPRFDSYCHESCTDNRCDSQGDCPMLKARRQQRVAQAIEPIVGFMATRHTAVWERSLVDRYFLDPQALDFEPASHKYLARDFARRLRAILQRDPRCDHRLVNGKTVWMLKGSQVPLPDVAAAIAQSSYAEHAQCAADRILAADRPMTVTELMDPNTALDVHWTAREEHLSRALSAHPSLRAVGADNVRGIALQWAPLTWLKQHLPSDLHLPPIVIRRREQAWIEDTALRPWQEEADDDGGATHAYIITIDDVVGGSLLIDPADEDLFPVQPNPAWLEIRDELGTAYDALLLARDNRCELFGLREVLLEIGADRTALRLQTTPTANVYSAEFVPQPESLPQTVGTVEDGVARRIWQHLLQKREWCTIDELAAIADVSLDDAHTLLFQHRCFEPDGPRAARWRIDPTQPGLRPPVSDRLTLATIDMSALLSRMLNECRDMFTALTLTSRELTLIDEELHLPSLGDTA